MPTKACIRLQDKQQDHHRSQHSRMVQSTTFLPELNAVLPFFNSSTSHCLSKLKNKSFSLTELQGHKHVIHNPENPFSELEAPKGWFLQGNLLRVLDVAKNKADKAEKPLGFKQSVAEPLNRIRLRMGLQNRTYLDFICASAAFPSLPVCAQHSCQGQCSPSTTTTDQQPFLWEDYLQFIPYPVYCSNKNTSTSIKQDLCRKAKLTEVRTTAEIKVSYSNIHKITVRNRKHTQWTWKTGH